MWVGSTVINGENVLPGDDQSRQLCGKDVRPLRSWRQPHLYLRWIVVTCWDHQPVRPHHRHPDHVHPGLRRVRAHPGRPEGEVYRGTNCWLAGVF